MHLSCLSLNILVRPILSYQRVSAVCLVGARYLYSAEALGLDSYLSVRERIKMQFDEMGDRFRAKMKEFVDPKSVNMVFTDDLKHMIHLSNGSEEDLQLIQDMMIKFSGQNKELRFGNYIFGPVVMRMYYHLNKPKEALEAFLTPELEHFFDQVISFQILMDLLFKNEMYDEVIQVADIVKDKQLPNLRFPKSVIVLALAAAYKKNTPESLQYMKNLWAELQESGHEPMRRAVTFAAALAINQGAAHIALELLSQIPKQNYVSVRNLKALALAEVNRPDDAVPILRSVLEVENPQEGKLTFCSEVVERVKEVVNKTDNKQIQQEFERTQDQLSKLGHITNTTLDDILLLEIGKFIFIPSRDQRILAAKFDASRANRQRFQSKQRPGLLEMD